MTQAALDAVRVPARMLSTDLSPVGTSGIIRAMHAVMKAVSLVRKDRQHPQHKFKFVGHDDVTEALREPFVEHGIIQCVDLVSQSRDQAGVVRVEVSVVWRSVEDGTYIGVTSFGESNPVVTRDGRVLTDDLQIGKAVSFAVKTIQLKTFMLIGGFPDNEASSPEMEQTPAQQRPTPVAPVKESSDEQIRLMVQEYAGITTKEKLGELRRAVGSLLSGLTEAQHTELERADRDAEQRVKNGSQ